MYIIIKKLLCHSSGFPFTLFYLIFNFFNFYFLIFFHYPLIFNCRMNSVFYSRETALREAGSEDSRLLLLYTAQNYTPILALFLFCVLGGTITYKMASDLRIYKTRIRCFYNRAVNNHDTVLFRKLSVISFYILCCTERHNRMTIALFFFFFADNFSWKHRAFISLSAFRTAIK